MTFKEDFKPTKVYNKLVNDVCYNADCLEEFEKQRLVVANSVIVRLIKIIRMIMNEMVMRVIKMVVKIMMIKVIGIVIVIIKFINVIVGLVSITPGHVKLD